jgi:glycerophosphoryl diester phosphodiesterase
VFAADTSSFLSRLKDLPASGARVWVNTMWGELCAGRNDDAALRDPEAHWGWALALGATIIQTDRPEQLIAWLKKKGRRT